MTKLKLETFLPYRLNRISAAVSQQFRSIYGPDFDLSVPEWRVLATLGQFEVATAKAIGAHSAMHKTKVSRAVKALEDRRWLRRRQSEEDRREELLQLTDLGRGIYLRIVPRAEAFEKRLLASLGDDAGAFLRGLEMIEEQRLDGVPLDSPDEGGQT
nr:MarR family transcriptional regulator [Mycoplana azooxidifex]